MTRTLQILHDLGVLDAALLVAHEAACSVLVWTVFCRAARTDRHTVRRSIRHAFGLLGAAACMGLAAPALGWRPDPVTLALLIAIAAVQIATARYWHHGPPPQFLRPELRQFARRLEDRP